MKLWLSLLAVSAGLIAGCSGSESPSSSLPPPPTPAPAVSSTSTLGPPSSTTSTMPAAPSTPSTTTSQPPATTPVLPGELREEYVRLPVGERKVVAFTFDAAYDPAPLDDILAALDEAGVRATFFLTGEFVEDFPEAVSAILAAGHPIGNHSYSHPDFTKLGPEETRAQLRRTADLLQSAGAADPRPLFRPPFGARNGTVFARLAEEGYTSIYWTIDTLDWKPERTPEQVRRAVVDNLAPGAIVLMHVGSRQTAEVLPAMIVQAREQGYELVTVNEALPGG